MENLKIKTLEQLDNQLNSVESLVGNRIGPESIRKELLSMSLDEIKDKHPREYQTYLNIFRTEEKLLHFPDIDTSKSIEKPKISLLQAGTRGTSFKINLGDNSRVIKPLESLEEKNVAEVASSLDVGPRQFKSKDGYIHEEFIDGTPLLNLEREKCTKEYMKDLGQKFAQSLKKLHDNNILVNDQILTNDFGKSHMIIDEKGEARFIDFGASIDISNFPDISDEAVISLIRTDPFMMFRVESILNLNEEDRKIEIKGYRDNILSQLKSKEDLIKMKDGQLLNEGLFFLQSRLPNVGYFIEGINEVL